MAKSRKTDPEYKTYRSEPGTTFGFTDPEGKQKTFRAGEDGTVTPRNAQEQAILQSFDLPVARADAPAPRTRTAKTAKTTPEPTTAPTSETGVTDAGR